MTRTYACTYVHNYLRTYDRGYVCTQRMYVPIYVQTQPDRYVCPPSGPRSVSLLPPFALLCFCTEAAKYRVSCVLCQGCRCWSSLLCCHVRTSLFVHRRSTVSCVLCPVSGLSCWSVSLLPRFALLCSLALHFCCCPVSEVSNRVLSGKSFEPACKYILTRWDVRGL
jgi:hypothetical protein